MGNQLFGRTAMFMAAMGLLTDSVSKQFANLVTSGQLQVIDHRYVVAKAVGGQSLIKMTDSADLKQIGVTNLIQGKPANNQFMILEAIKIVGLSVAGTDPVTVDSIKQGDYAEISALAGLENGLLTIKSDKKNIVYQLPLSAFLIGNKQCEKGLYHLANPKPIFPERDLDIEIELGTTSAPARAILKVELIGSCTNV